MFPGRVDKARPRVHRESKGPQGVGPSALFPGLHPIAMGMKTLQLLFPAAGYMQGNASIITIILQIASIISTNKF